MSCEEDTAELLKRAGYKMTPQRLLIVRALRHACGHVTASQIADDVRREYPFVDVSTVYRTLDVLRRMRLVTATDMGAGDWVYEWAPEQPHHHLICSSCGHVEEISHDYLEALEGQIVSQFRFRPDLDHFAIFGLCESCQVEMEA
jgi:Fur family ferric uptake transcriptional regulator